MYFKLFVSVSVDSRMLLLMTSYRVKSREIKKIAYKEKKKTRLDMTRRGLVCNIQTRLQWFTYQLSNFQNNTETIYKRLIEYTFCRIFETFRKCFKKNMNRSWPVYACIYIIHMYSICVYIISVFNLVTWYSIQCKLAEQDISSEISYKRSNNFLHAILMARYLETSGGNQ